MLYRRELYVPDHFYLLDGVGFPLFGGFEKRRGGFEFGLEFDLCFLSVLGRL